LKRFVETDVSDPNAKDKMRSSPILEESHMGKLFDEMPINVEEALLNEEDEDATI
jgi:hypothetical protein